jgi:enamine deaminase RidA (YjgF/YER057c/UK114 family)
MQAQGRCIFVSGQIGADDDGAFAGDDIVTQTRKALENIVTVLAAADAGVTDIVRLTWYVTDMAAYRSAQRAVGESYRAVMGDHYPAMSLVAVASLVEPRACVEIEATAVVPDDRKAAQ